MRFVLFALTLISLVGCLALQGPHNPLKKEASEAAPVSSATPAQVESEETPKPEEFKKEERTGLPLDDLPDDLDFDALPGLRISLMKEMFKAQLELNKQILKLAEDMSQQGLNEFNEFLSGYGLQMQRKRRSSTPTPAPRPRAPEPEAPEPEET